MARTMIGVNSDRTGPYRLTMDDDDAVLRHYGAISEERRITVGLGQLELVRTQEILRRHLPPAPARVLDVGGATGVHASWLAGDGYRVHIVDATPRHVEMARTDLGSLGVTADLGDARTLDLPDSSVDVVLLFGPLYHLTDGAERRQALREAIRVVSPGGLVAVAAISHAVFCSIPSSDGSPTGTWSTASTGIPTNDRSGSPPRTSTIPTSSGRSWRRSVSR
jgi:ubiquinone/menaquinone biosynthesis C-methylase UbiE